MQKAVLPRAGHWPPFIAAVAPTLLHASIWAAASTPSQQLHPTPPASDSSPCAALAAPRVRLGLSPHPARNPPFPTRPPPPPPAPQERVDEEPEQEMLEEQQEEEDLGPSIEELIERAQFEQVRVWVCVGGWVFAMHRCAPGTVPGHGG